MDSKIKFLAALIILIIVGGLLYYYFTQVPVHDVTDFTSCKNSGYEIIAGSPERCVTPDGKIFKGEINSTPDTEIANPASVNCEENNGTLDIRTDSEGGQYGVCMFSSGAECEEWAYYRGECIQQTQAVLDKEFSLFVGGIVELKQINLTFKVLNLTENYSTVSIKANHAGKESVLKATYSKESDSMVSFEGYSIKIIAITLVNGAAGKKPIDYIIRLKVSKEEKPADYSCAQDSDCAVKDVGNLCGKYLDCVNKNYTPVPPEIDSTVCGYLEIDGCKCVKSRCVGTIAGKPNIN